MKVKAFWVKYQTQIFAVAGAFFLLLAVFLLLRDARQIQRSPRTVRRQANVALIASWMTIPHLARIYNVPVNDLFAAIAHNPSVTPNDSIEAIARKEKKNPNILIKELRDEIVVLQSPK